MSRLSGAALNRAGLGVPHPYDVLQRQLVQLATFASLKFQLKDCQIFLHGRRILRAGERSCSAAIRNRVG